MTITLDLRPEIESRLLARAQAEGVSITDFVEAIVEREASHSEADPPTTTAEAKNLYELFTPVRGLLSDEEIDHLFSRSRSSSRPVDFS